jgi:hypothetical protein
MVIQKNFLSDMQEVQQESNTFLHLTAICFCQNRKSTHVERCRVATPHHREIPYAFAELSCHFSTNFVNSCRGVGNFGLTEVISPQIT